MLVEFKNRVGEFEEFPNSFWTRVALIADEEVRSIISEDEGIWLKKDGVAVQHGLRV